MMLRNVIKVTLAALLLHWGASASQADFIDSFDTPLSGGGKVFYSGGTSVNDTSSYPVGSPPNTVTRTRELTINHTHAGALGGDALIQDGRFYAGVDAGGTATFTLTYDAIGDISSFDRIVIADLDFDFSGAPLGVEVSLNNQVVSHAIMDSSFDDGADMVFLFSEWGMPLALNAVTELTVTFKAPEKGNFDMAGILFDSTAVVPEPAAMAMWLVVGIVGLVVGRRMYGRQAGRQAA